RSINVKEALTLLGVFLVQLVTKLPAFESIHAEARITVGVLYLVMAAVIIIRNRKAFPPLMKDGLRTPMIELAEAD
ncbi:MAG TPA: hypothetical protein VNC41_18085, partial [Acidimicrobiia bacterium]|nr:hypothetical protein [Acidimicrobiia bacterium]